ncbi:unnamed protein product [Tenebrio molitor]|nr:unnamed protein product [Tenebrio molitor]
MALLLWIKDQRSLRLADHREHLSLRRRIQMLTIHFVHFAQGLQE